MLVTTTLKSQQGRKKCRLNQRDTLSICLNILLEILLWSHLSSPKKSPYPFVSAVARSTYSVVVVYATAVAVAVAVVSCPPPTVGTIAEGNDLHSGCQCRRRRLWQPRWFRGLATIGGGVTVVPPSERGARERRRRRAARSPYYRRRDSAKHAAAGTVVVCQYCAIPL